jgi:hypothetical protein
MIDCRSWLWQMKSEKREQEGSTMLLSLLQQMRTHLPHEPLNKSILIRHSLSLALLIRRAVCGDKGLFGERETSDNFVFSVRISFGSPLCLPLSRLSSYRNLVRGWIKQHSRVKRSLIFRNFILSIIWELDGWTIESPSLHKNIMGTRNEFDDSVERDGDIRGLCSLQSCVEGEDDAKNTLWPVGNKSRDERSELT